MAAHGFLLLAQNALQESSATMAVLGGLHPRDRRVIPPQLQTMTSPNGSERGPSGDQPGPFAPY